jgi:signal transduction histidine kinase
MRWFRRLSLRGRLVLIGTAGLAVGLAAGGAVLVAVLHYVQSNALDESARRTALDVAGLVDAGALADPIPTAGTQIIQVLDNEGRVRAGSVGADRLVALLRPEQLRKARGGAVIRVRGAHAGQEGPLHVVAVRAGDAQEPRTVVVAAPAQDLETSGSLLRLALIVTYPVLVAVLAVLAWRVVGWALRPVEALRAGAEEITGAARVAYLPVPDGDDEVHRLAVTLNGMLDRLESARQRQRAFVGDAAHELRSPLASLRTQLEVADRLGEPVPPAELLADVNRLGRLVDDLLLLARADEGDPRLRRRQPVELGALGAEVAAGYTGGRVPVRTDGAGPVWTWGDPDGLRRLLDNLVSNAVRHAGTAVTVAAESIDGRPALVVVDDGPGVPQADRERVFQRFTRLDDARTRATGEAATSGAGLGLAIVRELVRLHQGGVTLSDAQPGLRVTVHLVPCPDPAEGADPGGPHPDRAETGGPAPEHQNRQASHA